MASRAPSLERRGARGPGETGIPSAEEVLRAEPAVVGRAITLAERGDPRFAKVLADLRAREGRAFRVGVTGPPGAGKSSLLREVLRRLRQGGRRVALVACDPVSPLTGGAFLGDRVRFADLAADPGIFIRSVARRPGPAAPESAAAGILDAAGWEWIFLETVGAGQADTGELQGQHVRLYVHAPGGGDYIQMLKAGLLETADLHAVNKADRPEAAAWAKELAETLARGGSAPPVFLVSALTGEGVDALVEDLARRREARKG